MKGRDSSPPSVGRATDPLVSDAAARATESLPEDGAGAPALPPVREGDVLMGKYRVEGVIGAGGMGIVVAAMHLQLKTRVALKLVRPSREHRGLAVARLLREAQAAARIRSEHVARVMDVGTLDSGVPYIVMEYLTGRDLGAELRARGPLPVEDAVDDLLQACEAVAEAHAAGIVHRDLKPSNLFLTQRADGSPLVKVLDFGIAKALEGDEGQEQAALTASSAVLGSPVYMSPEQLRSASAVDARTDVWSLGVILYELVSGQAPFTGSSASARLAAIAADPPTPLGAIRPELPATLEAVILRCLDKDVERRMPSVAALARALAPFAPSRSAGSIERVEATLGVAPQPERAPARRARRRSVLGAVAAALFVAAAGGLWTFKAASPQARSSPSRPAGRRAVAVLGFKDLSGKPASAWMSTAFAELLSAELSAGEQLRTIRGESVARARMEVGGAPADGLTADALERVRKSLGADVVVLGTYLALSDKVRLDIRIEDAAPGGGATSISETGTEAELFELVARAGSRLRLALGFAALSPQEQGLVRASRPASAEAARLYAEGLSKLRQRDPLGAQSSLAAATAADPGYPLAHAALAEASSALGRDAEAKAEAKRAFELSTGLSREERLLVEGRYRTTTRSWEQAVAIYRGLFGFFPDNLEYGLLLVETERLGGQGKNALATVEALRKLPAPAREDPRIDIEEALAAESIDDWKRERESAGRALSRAEAEGTRYLCARARMPLAYAHLRLGDPARARTLYEEARQLFAAVGDRSAEARALSNLAIVRAEQGDADAAGKLLEESLSIQRALGNRVGIATALNNLANLSDDQGRPAEARARFEEALTLFRAIDDLRGVSAALGNIGSTWLREGDFAAAQRKFEEALAVARKVGADADVASMTFNVGDVLYQQGDLAGASETFQEALALSRKLEDGEGTANALAGLGAVLFQQAELAGAGKRFEEALALRERMGSKGPAAQRRLALAELALEQGDAAKAETLAREAADALHEAKMVEEASARALLLRALLSQGKRVEADEAARGATALLAAADAPETRIPLVLAMARAGVVSGQATAITRGLKDAEAAIGDARRASAATAFEARLALGELELLAARPAGAARLDALARDASKQGFVRIARRAARPRK